MLTGTFSHSYGTDDTAKDVILLTADAQREGILRTTEEEGGCTSCSTLERRHRLLAQLYQTVVEHGAYQTVDIIIAQVLLRVFLTVGSCLTLLVEMTEDNRLLGIFLYAYNHRVVVVDRIIYAFCGILRHRDRREGLLDLLLHLVDIEIAHHDDSLQVGTIPFMIIVTQILIREIVYYIHRSDRHAVFILRAFIHLWHSLLHQSLYSHACTTCAPLLVDDTTLLVDLCIFQQQIVAPVVEHQQTGVDDTLTLQRG